MIPAPAGMTTHTRHHMVGQVRAMCNALGCLGNMQIRRVAYVGQKEGNVTNDAKQQCDKACNGYPRYLEYLFQQSHKSVFWCVDETGAKKNHPPALQKCTLYEMQQNGFKAEKLHLKR